VISAIVLAAGESKRMGQDKLLLPWKGETILEHVLRQIQQAELDEVILVLGHEAERILEKVSWPKIKIVVNPAYREGMSTSLRQGLMAMDEKAEAFLIILGDQPGISKEIVNRLIQTYRQTHPRKGIVLPTHQGLRGHPVLFSSAYREKALRLKGDVGGRQILKEHSEDLLEVEINTEAILEDIDTPEDYQKHLAHPLSPSEGVKKSGVRGDEGRNPCPGVRKIRWPK